MSSWQSPEEGSPPPGSRQREPGHLLLFLDQGWPGRALPSKSLSLDGLIAFLQRRGFTVHWAPSLRQAEVELSQHPIGVGIVDLESIGPSLYRVYELLRAGTAPVPVLLVGSPRFRERTTRPRALDKGEEYVCLDQTFSYEYLALRLRRLLLRTYPNWEAAADDTGADQGLPGRDGPLGRLVCVTATRDGSGKTTVAANLAVGMAELYRRQVIVIDADLHNGDVDVALGVRSSAYNPRRSLNDLAGLLGWSDGDWRLTAPRAVADLSARLLEHVLYRHASGLRVLPGPEKPGRVDEIVPWLLPRVVEVSRGAFEFTIVDMPSAQSELSASLLEAASSIVVVLKPEVSSVRTTVRFVEEAAERGWSEKLVLVLNRADSSRVTGVARSEVEAQLGRRTLPINSSSEILQAVAEGGVAITHYPGSKVAEGFRQVLAQIANEPTTDQPRRPLQGLLGRRYDDVSDPI